MTNISLPDGRGQQQGWLMSDKKAHQAMWQFGVQPGNGTAIVVLHFLTSRLHRGTNAVVMSFEAIAKTMNLTDKTIKTAIKKLADARFIQILKSGKSNVYVINHQVAWQGSRGARFAAFGAELLVHEGEQDTPVDQLIEGAKELQTVPILDFGERLLVGNETVDPPDQGELSLS
jgi:hypothetical protein